MKKTLFTAILSLTFIFALILTLASCEKEEETPAPIETTAAVHIHDFGEWITVKEATKTEDGEKAHSCACGVSETETVYAYGSYGLKYRINEDGKTCTVFGIGDCTDTEIYIGRCIDGYTVTAIDDCAFYGLTKVTAITLPDSIVSIGDSAFAGCTSLLKISIPDSVTEFGDFVFTSCTVITEIYIPAGITDLVSYSFNGCTRLSTLTLPADLKKIDGYAFQGCTALKNIKFDGTINTWKTLEKDANWNASLHSCAVHCTNGSIQA